MGANRCQVQQSSPCTRAARLARARGCASLPAVRTGLGRRHRRHYGRPHDNLRDGAPPWLGLAGSGAGTNWIRAGLNVLSPPPASDPATLSSTSAPDVGRSPLPSSPPGRPSSPSNAIRNESLSFARASVATSWSSPPMLPTFAFLAARSTSSPIRLFQRRVPCCAASSTLAAVSSPPTSCSMSGRSLAGSARQLRRRFAGSGSSRSSSVIACRAERSIRHRRCAAAC
jgi:hypothetical protein